jgi:putative ABC transport system ATP-binding protein
MVYRLHRVTKRLEQGGAAFTLNIPKLELASGTITAFVGQSGCGKTTLLDMLGLVSPPTEAVVFEVEFASGARISPATSTEATLAAMRRRHLGYILQTGGLLPFLSAGGNIMLSRLANGMGGNTGAAKALARSLGVGEQWGKKPDFLSGGQRQRVAIARALAHSPSVVLADEPTGSVDKLTARDIRDLLYRAAHDHGVTIILVTHDLELISDRTDRVYTFEVRRVSDCHVESTVVESNWAEIGRNART